MGELRQNPDVDGRLRQVVEELRQRLAEDEPAREPAPADVHGTTADDIAHDALHDPGHDRWALYRRAASAPTAWPLLLRAVRWETDPALASAVVVLMLEKVPGAERKSWVSALAPTARPFSLVRLRELAVYERLCAGVVPEDFGPDDIEGWSDWLQRRAALGLDEERVLTLLARTGRTKKARRTALERLRPMVRSRGQDRRIP